MNIINISTIITCLSKPQKQYITLDDIVIDIHTKYDQILCIIDELIDLGFDISIISKYTTLECKYNILCNIIVDVVLIDGEAVLIPDIYTNMDNNSFNIIVDTNNVLTLLVILKRNYLK